MRNTTILRIAAAAFGLAMTASAASAVTYTETFPDGVGDDDDSVVLRSAPVNWCGGNAGDGFCNNPVAGPGSANEGGEGAVSDGNGPDGTPGFAYFSQKGISNVFLYTNEFAFQSADLTGFGWQMRNGSPDDEVRLFFRIGQDYYVTDQTYTTATSTVWTGFSLDALALEALTFQILNNGTTDTLPSFGGNNVGTALDLPIGLVDAFGFHVPQGLSQNIRFDDVSVNVIPLPAGAWLLVSGFAAAFGARRLSRRAA